MKIFLKALLWSARFEALLVLLWAVGYVGLPFLSYVALWCHFPALYFWPAAGDTLVGAFLFQWLTWFVLFTAVLVVRRAFKPPTSEHENEAA